MCGCEEHPKNEWPTSWCPCCGIEKAPLKRLPKQQVWTKVWTKYPPTMDGWYWHRKDISCEAGMAYVRDGHVVGTGWRHPVESAGGEWFGPLQAPGGDAVENYHGGQTT